MFEGFWGRFQGSARLRQVFVRFVLTCRRCRLFGLPRSAAGRMGGSRSRCSCAACAPSGCVDRPTPPKPFLSGRRMCAHPIRASQPCGSRFANKRPQPNASPESARRPGDSARKRPFLRGRRTAGALPAFGPLKKRDEVLTSMNVGVPETPRVWHTRKRPPGADRFSRPTFLPKPTHKTASRSHDRQCR